MASIPTYITADGMPLCQWDKNGGYKCQHDSDRSAKTEIRDIKDLHPAVNFRTYPGECIICANNPGWHIRLNGEPICQALPGKGIRCYGIGKSTGKMIRDKCIKDYPMKHITLHPGLCPAADKHKENIVASTQKTEEGEKASPEFIQMVKDRTAAWAAKYFPEVKEIKLTPLEERLAKFVKEKHGRLLYHNENDYEIWVKNLAEAITGEKIRLGQTKEPSASISNLAPFTMISRTIGGKTPVLVLLPASISKNILIYGIRFIEGNFNTICVDERYIRDRPEKIRPSTPEEIDEFFKAYRIPNI